MHYLLPSSREGRGNISVLVSRKDSSLQELLYCFDYVHVRRFLFFQKVILNSGFQTYLISSFHTMVYLLKKFVIIPDNFLKCNSDS